MFLGKSPDAFAKHLPAVANQALVRKDETPATSIVQKISLIGRQITAQGHVETFDVGPTLLVTEQEEGNRKVKTEVIVEHDASMGENEEIELSVHVYKDGELEFLPVVPRLTFSMTQEKEIWKLTEATLAAHIPLTDPDYLKGMRKMQNESNENLASAQVSMITLSEAGYASKHPDQGYSCSIPDLLGKSDVADTDQRSENFAAGLTGSDFGGYHFALSGCDGKPASKFQIVAVPTESDSEMKTFCADESGTVRFQLKGKAASCLSRGQVLNQGEANSGQLD